MTITQDISEIGYKLERFHGVFYQLWGVTNFLETKQIPTCGVSWNKKTRTIDFLINPKFWETRDEYNKMFIICHEMMHLLLRHPMRISKNMNRAISNIAQDICINEMLINNFNFDRTRIQDQEKLMWLDTVPFNVKNIEAEREFEYYYNRIEQDKNQQQTVDDHSQWGTPDDIKELEKAMEEALADMEEEELEDLKTRLDDIKAGTEHLDKLIKVQRHVKNSQKWRKIFKHWIHKIEDEAEDWTRQNRRLNILKDSSFILPAPHEREERREKGDVWLFLDTSGSCEHLAQDFFDAANSIPRAHFNVRLFGFSMKVYEVKGNNLKDFGGTSFSCIEDFLRQQEKYPAAVFVITDGHGNNVKPLHPDRWYWFLSANPSVSCIPRVCPKFKIEDLTPIR